MEENELLNITEEDINDSADRLKIDIEEDDIDPKSQTSKHDRRDTSDSSDDEDALPENCIQIEEKVCKTAAKNHLSHSNVKNILKRVVSNEHVLAIVKLQEEEMQDAESSTITRSKAKKLMKTAPTPSWSLPMTPVKMPQLTSPEVTSLIAQDLPDEESDEEYQPNPDEHSDDENDTIGSMSDVDSQPRTPATPGQLYNEMPESPSTKWTDDGLFKLPKIVTPVKEKEVTKEATIALRTRSKLCLSDTPIETIEESFIPPDITEDMYDFGDCGLDHDWKNFLTDFTKPLPQTHEDDDEADPEYNVDADKQTCEFDAAEELRQDRALKVTRKELKDLVAELFEFDDIFDVQEAVMAGPNSNIVPVVIPQCESLIHTNADYSGKFMDLSKAQVFTKTVENPQKHLSIDEYNAQLTEQNSEIQMSNYLMVPNENQISQPTLPLQIDVGSEPCTSVPSNRNDLLETKTKKSNHIIIFNEEEWIYKESDANLEQMQRDILDQQMRQHVQIATQCFLQLHGHPEFWAHGPQQLEYLMSLRYLGLNKENSAFHPCNLDNAIKICEEWQAKLAEDTEEMREMMKFIKTEIFKSKRRRSQNSFYACKFPQQYFDAIVDSDVFIYPELLPSIPFRVDQTKSIHHTYLESEERLIALGLSEFYEYIAANKELFGGRVTGFQYRKISELLSKYLIPILTPAKLKRRIKLMKNPKLPDNPIQYYYLHQKPPETKHRILSFGPNCTPRDHHKDLLPYLWRNILYPRISRKEATFRKAVGSVEPLKSFISNRNEYFKRLNEERGVSLIDNSTAPSLNNTSDLTDKDRIPDSQPEVPGAPCWTIPPIGVSTKSKQKKNTTDYVNSDKSSDLILNSNIIVADGSKIQIFQPNGEGILHRFLLNKCQCSNNLLDGPIPKGQTRVTEFFSSSQRKNSSGVDKNTICNTDNPIAARVRKQTSENRSYDSVNPLNNINDLKKRVTPPKLNQSSPLWSTSNILRHPNGRFMRKYPTKILKNSAIKDSENCSKRDSTVLYKLECFISICKKRKASLTSGNISKKNFKSHMLETISSKLANQIKELENMLPSMPHLSSASKENIDLSDDSNEMTVQPLLPDAISSKDNNTSPVNTGRLLDSAIKKVPDDRPPMQARNVNKTSVTNNTPKHRLALKMQKELDANRAMFTTNRYADNLRDTLFATAYFERVQTRLNSDREKNGTNTDSEQFLVFQNILDSFDPLKQTPCDLYYTLKTLFGAKNADLTEEFLAFLTAGQAAEIGRFMDHFLLISMAEFIERLQIYFARKPAQLRKVLWCLERLVEDVNNSENGVISMETVKSTILPHLKSSQYLVDWFLKLFPGEKPPESYANNGYEILDIERMAKDYVEDQFSEDLDHEVLNVPPIEENYGNDSCTCVCHNSSDPKYQSRVRHCIPCGMKYMQGRVYIQHGRGLRGARVSWGEGEGEGDNPSGQIGLTVNDSGMAAQARRLSAPATRVTRKRAASLDPPQTRTDSDDERVSPKRILRFLRTPTSKNKFSKLIPCSKNLNKSLDNIEGSNVANKPSCSKSIMKDVERLDSVPGENAECLAEALPEPSCDQEELTIFNDSDQHISLLAARLKGERRDSGYIDRSQLEPQDECESDGLDASTISARELSLADSARHSVANDISSQSETDCDIGKIKQEPENDTLSHASMSSQSIKVEDESNWTRDEDKAILLVLQCAKDSDNTFEKINALLPHRSMSEIRERFLNVMQLLQQMALQPE